MQVILVKSVPKLGQPHDLVNVKTGFARNFLFPQKLAVMATPSAVARGEKIRAERVKKMEEVKANAQKMAQELQNTVLVFKKKARGESLYGSLSEKDIAAALVEQRKMEIDKDLISLSAPIKKIGTFTATLKLAEGVSAPVTIQVERDEQAA